MEVLLVTSSGWPDGEPGHGALDAALAERGIGFRWVCWDDPEVDWAAADLVAVRSTWDYVERPDEFLTWARAVEQRTPVLNGADVFAWNVDKAYLAAMADEARVPVLATTVVSGLGDLVAARAAYGALVVKPRVGAGGAGVRVLGADADLAEALAEETGSGLVVQPLVESVRTTGEVSVFVVDGQPTVQVRKHPGAGEIRVHEHLGGTYAPEPLDDALAALATGTLAVAADLTGRRIDYGRVDLLHWRGGWHVSEVEVVEPSLYLDLLDANASPFAALVQARIRSV